MEDILNPLFLSRIQFTFVVTFHIVFPALTIGLASWLAVLEGCWLKTKHPVYKEMYQHWVKIFAVAFAMGVVSGIVMAYQFGTNWAIFSHKAGNVIGPLLAFEVLTAFFLEASFLGIMLFGWNKVGPKLHFFSTLMVAIGTVVSAFWILSVNSWMQTPAGYIINDQGIFFPASWINIIFNPSFVYRLLHMILAAYLTTAFVVGGVSGWYLLKNKFVAHARISFMMAMLMAVTLPFVQSIVGHAHGENTLKHQPAKIAAMEGIWETEKGANLKLFGIPDQKEEKTKYSIEIPYGASIILKGNKNATITGLKDFPKDERPPVAIVFYSFRIMVGISMLMMLTGLLAIYLYKKGTLFQSKNFHKWCFYMLPSGFIALISGWIVTEVGRQPYVIYNLLKTKDSVSAISTVQTSVSLLLFFVVYTIVFGFGTYYMAKLVRKGPSAGDWHDSYGVHGLKDVTTISDVFIRKHDA